MKWAILSWIAIVLSAGQAVASEWRLTGITDSMLQAVDVSNVRTEGSARVFWSVTAYSVRQEEGQDYTLFQERIDCNRQTVQVLSWTDRRIDETSYTVSSNDREQVSPLVPESVGWSKYEAICNGSYYTDLEPFDSSRDFAEVARLYLSEQ